MGRLTGGCAGHYLQMRIFSVAGINARTSLVRLGCILVPKIKRQGFGQFPNANGQAAA
jgi:hypothetical protein